MRVICKVISNSTRNLFRDYNELSHIQNSSTLDGFVKSSVHRTIQSLIEAFKNPVANYLVTFSGYNLSIGESDAPIRIAISPICGLQNFKRSIPYFCIVATTEDRLNNEYRMIGSVIDNPVTKESFYAMKGMGAFVNGVRIKSVEKLSRNSPIVATNIPFRGIIPNSFDIRCSGCNALDLVYLAAGKYDATITSLDSHHEVASGLFIAKEAGVIATKINDNTGSYIIASNNTIHNNLLDMMRQKL